MRTGTMVLVRSRMRNIAAVAPGGGVCHIGARAACTLSNRLVVPVPMVSFVHIIPNHGQSQGTVIEFNIPATIT